MLVINIKTLIGVQEETIFKKGEDMKKVGMIDHAYLRFDDGRIIDYGRMEDLPTPIENEDIIDAAGRCVMPTWIDSHTHIVFAQPREKEYVARIEGKSYEEIAREGGGILNSARILQETSEDELFRSAEQRLLEVIGYGTGAIEIKSGYGLTVESELKMLRVVKRLKEKYDLPIKATFLGAHAFPREMTRETYLRSIIDEMLPKINEEQLADYIDVFCDEGFFTVEETALLLEEGAKYGLKPKIHANELANSGGVQVGIAHGAISVDHLEQIGEDEITALMYSDTIPTALPSCSYFLNIPYAPTRRMIDRGLGIVLATDYNPGSSPSGKIPFLMSLACTKMKLLPEEAFNAVTNNAAFALELQHVVGSISKNKYASFIMTKEIPSLSYISYAFGSDTIDQVWIKGKRYK